MSGMCSSYAIENDETSGPCLHPAGYQDSGSNDWCACHFGPPYDPAQCDEYKVAPATDIASLAVVAAKLQDLDAQRAELIAQRDSLVVAARKDRWSWGKLQDATGLSRQALDLIARRANSGKLPTPDH